MQFSGTVPADFDLTEKPIMIVRPSASRFGASRLRVSAILIGALVALFGAVPAAARPPAPASPVLTAPESPGQNCAAGYMADPNSGNCWQMTGQGSPTVSGGPCMPGRIGTCLGYLANNPMSPGDTLNRDTWP